MNKYIPTAFVKLHAKRSMKGKFGTILASCLIELAIILGVSAIIIAFMPGGFERFRLMTVGTFDSLEDQVYYQANALNLFFNVISLVSVPFAFVTVGRFKVVLNAVRGREVSCKQVFSFYGRWYIASLFPLLTIILGYGVTFIQSFMENVKVNDSIVALLILMCQCVVYFLSYKLMFVNNALADNDCKNFIEAVKLSWKITDGKMFVNVLVLSLSFIGWFILSMFTLGLLFLYVIPYMETSVTTLYDMAVQFIKQNTENTTSNE
ncbi:MAG: DUF975 family protein [Clostridia bacterium]